MSSSIKSATEGILRTILTRFPSLAIRVCRCPFVEGVGSLRPMLRRTGRLGTFIVRALIIRGLDRFASSFYRTRGLPYCGVLGSLIGSVSGTAKRLPLGETNTLRHLSSRCFGQVDTVRFTIGCSSKGSPGNFLSTSLILLNISHASGAPLSVFLTGGGVGMTGLPVVPRTSIPRRV